VPKVPIVLREFIFNIFLSNVKIKISDHEIVTVIYFLSPSLYVHRSIAYFAIIIRAKF